MKKVLSLALLLGSLAATASAAPYYMTEPSGGDLIPYDWQPVYSVHGIYNWGGDKSVPDTAGARVNFSLYSNAAETVRHQFSISAGYETGSQSYNAVSLWGVSRNKSELTKIPLTLAYDLNVAISDNVMLDLSARGGYSFGTIIDKSDLWAAKSTTHTGGFTYTLGAGLKVYCSDDVYVKLGYEFSRTFFTENLPSHATFNQHGIVFGIGCSF